MMSSTGEKKSRSETGNNGAFSINSTSEDFFAGVSFCEPPYFLLPTTLCSFTNLAIPFSNINNVVRLSSHLSYTLPFILMNSIILILL